MKMFTLGDQGEEGQDYDAVNPPVGGISNGVPIVVRIAIKPTSSIAKSQETVNMKSMESASLLIKGRHDACIVPRAVVVVEAMIAVTLCDLALRVGLIPRVMK